MEKKKHRRRLKFIRFDCFYFILNILLPFFLKKKEKEYEQTLSVTNIFGRDTVKIFIIIIIIIIIIIVQKYKKTKQIKEEMMIKFESNKINVLTFIK